MISPSGLTSTISNPITCLAFLTILLIIFKISIGCKPKASGLDVPGAYAGSTESISILI
ncbi:hypothetical protein D1872_316710 [compost metagenome]